MIEKRQDPRVRRTRHAFQIALFELLQAKEFEDIRIIEIANKAGFSRNAFYSNFESKEALLFSYIDDVFDQVLQAAESDFESAKDLDVDLLANSVFDIWRSNAELLRYVMQVAKRDMVIARFRTNALAFIKIYREYKSSESARIEHEDYVIDFVAGGWFMLFKRWTDEGMRVDSRTMAQLLTNITPVDLLIGPDN